MNRPLRMLLLPLLALLLLARSGHTLDNGVARTPPMGWNSWYDLAGSASVAAMNESMVMRTVDAMVALGLPKLGYRYISLDDGYVEGRDATTGKLFADRARFPSGMAALSRYVHARGLKFGVYTARCAQTCCHHPGSLNHEELDARTFALDWQVDLVKEDACQGCPAGSDSLQQYTKFSDALNKTGREVVFAICGISENYYPNASSVGNMWRIGTDDGTWNTVLDNVDAAVGKSHLAGPGGWNDPCMLNSRDYRGRPLLTELQVKAQFSMWAVLAAPLIISGTLLRMSAETLAVYTNTEVVAVSQDPLGSAGDRLAGGNTAPITNGLSFNGPAAIAAPCQHGRAAQNWSFGAVQGFEDRLRNGDGVCTATDACNCTNVASGSPAGLLDVEGYCGNGTNLGFRLRDGQLQSSVSIKGQGVAEWSLCASARPSDNWVQMGKCNSGSATQWTHDATTGQLRTTAAVAAAAAGVGAAAAAAAAAADATTELCLDWKDHVLRPQQATNVWGRALSGGAHALVLLNVASTPRTVACDAACFGKLGYNDSTAVLEARDLWAHKPLPDIAVKDGFAAADLPADGGVAMIKVWPKAAPAAALGSSVAAKTDDAHPAAAGCTVRAAHCFGGRRGYFLYDFCGMANRSWVVKDGTGWKEPYLVGPVGQPADVSSCAACSGKRARAFQLYPSLVGGHAVDSYCNASHADRCFPLGSAGGGSGQSSAAAVSPLNESDPSAGVALRWSGGYAALQLNLSCCPSCGYDSGPVAVRESQRFFAGAGWSYSFSWPTAAACPRWVDAADCGFQPVPKPQPAQLEWIQNEIGALIHFNYQTSLGGNRGCGSYTPDSFNPAAEGSFTDQWARSMLDLGVKHAVLVAKHDCGFTLWPTKAKQPDGRRYNFSIAQSRYKAGKGDVVADFVASMQRAGLEHGFYCSQGLKQNGYARLQNWTTAEYSPVIRTFFTELWSDEKYTGTDGLLRELWMDGGVEMMDRAWIKQAVAVMQPNASVFSGCCLFNGSLPAATDGSRDTELASNCVTKNPVSWVGTEAGHSPDDTWSTGLQWGGGSSSSPTASFREADTVLQKTQWFFTGEELRSLPDLIDSYETTAGHNSLFMIDFAPQPDGLLHPLHVAMYKALGDWIRECYGSGRVANTSAPQMHWLQGDSNHRAADTLSLELSEPSFVNRIVLQEDLQNGQVVRAWEVEGRLANASRDRGAQWVGLASGQSIGNKNIAVLSNATAVVALRLRIVRAAAEVVSIKNFAAHSCWVPADEAPLAVLRQKTDDTAPLCSLH